MLNVPINLIAMNRTPAAARQSQAPAKQAASPKTDVIDLSRMKITRYEGASNLEMRSPSSHYIPQHLNEDGSWSLAEYVPFTIDGPLPDGAMPLPSQGDQNLLNRLDQLADQLRSGFDARA